MPDDQPSLQIDTDWKKQAQEEKRRLAEQQKQAPATAPGAMPAAPGEPPGAGAAPRDPRQRGAREMPPASLSTLVQSIVTQALFALGEIAIRGQAPAIDLDSAKHHIDTLGVLEEKTRGNLTPEEQRLLDTALYETRMRYVNVASQYIS
jgi:Domain of unknown function (DUF1844)